MSNLGKPYALAMQRIAELKQELEQACETNAARGSTILRLEAELAKVIDALQTEAKRGDELQLENQRLRDALKNLLNSEWQDDDGNPRLELARDNAWKALEVGNE